MKKVIFVVMMFAVIMMVSAVYAEPASTWFEARNILVEYAKENEMNWWIESHVDRSSETRFDILTADKQSLMEYGFDFGNHTCEEFAEFLEEQYSLQLPEADVDVKVVPCDVYKDTVIWELLVTSNIDLEPNNKEVVKNGRALFVVY